MINFITLRYATPELQIITKSLDLVQRELDYPRISRIISSRTIIALKAVRIKAMDKISFWKMRSCEVAGVPGLTRGFNIPLNLP